MNDQDQEQEPTQREKEIKSLNTQVMDLYDRIGKNCRSYCDTPDAEETQKWIQALGQLLHIRQTFYSEEKTQANPLISVPTLGPIGPGN